MQFLVADLPLLRELSNS